MERLIPIFNPGLAYLARKDLIDSAISKVLKSGIYILGEEVRELETRFAEWLGVSFTIATGNGTDAIELALRAFGVGNGSLVFTVSHTAVATVSAIERAGATPFLVDIDPNSYTISPGSFAEAIDKARQELPGLRLAAVVPVHLYGHPCDMANILDIARSAGIVVVEDCAQAHGAYWNGIKVGSIGAAGAFSFYPTKNIGALGDAGAVSVNDPDLAEKIRALREYGWRKRYISETPGINSRMDPLQAAILSVQLDYATADGARREWIARRYNEALQGSDVKSPLIAENCKHAYHLYVVRCSRRQMFMDFMRARGIATSVHYPRPVHLQPAYLGRVPLAPRGLPVTETLAQEIVTLPIFPQLTDGEVLRICSALEEWSSPGLEEQ
jgi:dTDP-4-amino-4,6-dideoxygalactose transaminase